MIVIGHYIASVTQDSGKRRFTPRNRHDSYLLGSARFGPQPSFFNFDLELLSSESSSTLFSRCLFGGYLPSSTHISSNSGVLTISSVDRTRHPPYWHDGYQLTDSSAER